MTVTLEIPDQVAQSLKNQTGDVSREVLEGYAVQAYLSGKLSSGQISKLLGHSSRFETWDFLAEQNAWPGLSDEEALKDIKSAVAGSRP